MTRKQFTVIAARLKEELKNIKSLLKELSDKGLTGPRKKINLTSFVEDTFALRAIGSK